MTRGAFKFQFRLPSRFPRVHKIFSCTKDCEGIEKSNHFFFFLPFFLDGDFDRDLERFFRELFDFSGDGLRDRDFRFRCLLLGGVRDRLRERPREELLLRDLERFEAEGVGLLDW